MKSTKKILGASAALGLAVALSAGSTFAWFVTANRMTAKVGNLDVTVVSTADGGEVLNVFVPTLVSYPDGTDPKVNVTEFTPSKALTGLTTPELQPLTMSIKGGKMVLQTEEHDGDADNATEDEGFLEFTVGFHSTSPLKIYLDTTKEVKNGEKVVVEANQSSVAPKGTAPKVESWNLSDRETSFLESLVENDSGWKASAYYSDRADVITLNSVTGTTYDNVTGTVSLNARAANATRLYFGEIAPTSPAQLIWSPNEALFSGAEFEPGNTVENGDYQGFYQYNLARDYRALKAQLINGQALALPDKNDLYEQRNYSGGQYKKLVPYKQTTETNDNLTGTNAATPIATLQKKTALAVTGGVLLSDGKRISPDAYIGTGDGGATDPNYYAFVNVKVWLEGTDGDCFESVLGDAMSINLAFRAVKDESGS